MIPEFVFLWLLGAYMLHSVTKHLRFEEAGVARSFAVASVGAAAVAVIPNGGHAVGLLFFAVLLKAAYRCPWSQAFDAMLRTLFFTAAVGLAAIYTVGWL